MKSIRYLIGFALMALLLSGCMANAEPEGTFGSAAYDIYNLHISFKDSLGNDLVAPLGEEMYNSAPNSTRYRGQINPDKYSLYIQFSNGTYVNNAEFLLKKYDENYSLMSAKTDGTYDEKGDWSLYYNLVGIGKKSDDELFATMTFRFQCETIFGDVSYHDIITWWKEGSRERDNRVQYCECSSATIDGKEIKPIKGVSYNDKGEPYYVGYFLDIVLER